MMDFLPEYESRAIPGGMHRPLYRLFYGTDFREVRRRGDPLLFETASAAVNCAKDHVRRLLNRGYCGGPLDPADAADVSRLVEAATISVPVQHKPKQTRIVQVENRSRRRAR